MIIYLKLFLTAFFWGGTFIAGRVIATDIPPFSASFIRFTLAAIIMLGLTRHLEGKLPRVNKIQFFMLFMLGMTGVFAYNVFFFKGLKLIQAGRASIIIANNPIFICIFSALIFREKLTPVKFAGIIISVCGAVIAISKGNPKGLFSGGVGLGDLFIFICVLCWVSYSLIGKSVMDRFSPFVSVTYSSLIGAAALFPAACVEGLFRDIPGYALTDWGSLAYLSVFGTVLGFVWYYEGIRAIGPSRASLFINFVPIAAILLAFFILGEPLTWSLLGGAALVTTGVLMTNLGGDGSKKQKIESIA